MTNERTRHIFEIRRRVIRAIRSHLDNHGCWEVEGPILQSIQGGATARPFISHHNALDIDMYLRIALELHLKRLVVGGMERVFEIGRVFRNEGIDVRHNPEFTMLEAYQAFADYTDMMDLVEGTVVAAVSAALEGDFVVHVGDHTVDLTPPWPRVTMADLIEQKLGVRLAPTMPVEAARRILDGLHVEWEAGWGAGKLMKHVVDEKIQHDIVVPCSVSITRKRSPRWPASTGPSPGRGLSVFAGNRRPVRTQSGRRRLLAGSYQPPRGLGHAQGPRNRLPAPSPPGPRRRLDHHPRQRPPTHPMVSPTPRPATPQRPTTTTTPSDQQLPRRT